MKRKTEKMGDVKMSCLHVNFADKFVGSSCIKLRAHLRILLMNCIIHEPWPRSKITVKQHPVSGHSNQNIALKIATAHNHETRPDKW